MNRFNKWLSVSLLVMLGIVIGATLVPSLATLANNTRPTLDIGSDILTEAEKVYADVYTNLSPSVVSITVAAQSDSNSGLLNVATGSGFVIDTIGHIVTNDHVVDGSDRIEVQFFDGTITRAKIVGTDPDSDIAVIKVDLPADRLRPVVFANSDTLQVGQGVLALGNPFQNNWTLTSGIISAINRRIIGLNNYSVGGVIQTDAAINPGNSGGPLLNLRGEVIGMNSQIESGTGSNSGIGFAVPSNLIAKVAAQLISNGGMVYSYMGISTRPIDLDLIEAFDLPNNIQGVAILQVVEGLPAAEAGIRTISNQSVDIIVAIDGNPMQDFDELVGWLAINTNPGQSVRVTVYRNGQIFDTDVLLVERPTQ
jgi:2-alkenal reductase